MHEGTTSEEIEVLIIAPEFHITGSILASDRHGVIPLHDRIEKFLEGDTLSCLISLREVITIEHLCHGEVFREFTYSGKVHLIKSFTIVVDLKFRYIDNARKLVEKCTSMLSCLFTSEHRTFCILVTRISDLCRRITEKEDSSMSHLLELAELHKRDHVSEVDLRCDWINPEFYYEFLSGEKLLFEIFLIDDTSDPLMEEIVDLRVLRHVLTEFNIYRVFLR